MRVYLHNLLHKQDAEGLYKRIDKLYNDKDSGKFIMTWHTPHLDGKKEDPEKYWASQRILYVYLKIYKLFLKH